MDITEPLNFLASHSVKGRLIFAMITGSSAYNLANQHSDLDYVGVYIYDVLQFLSMDNNLPKDALATLPTAPQDATDVTLYEIGQFAQLLMKGNPFCIEAVFCRSLRYTTEDWDDLQKIRTTLLNQRTVRQYLSYSRNQWKQHLEKKKKKGKRLYHIVRLLCEARRIVMGQEPLVWVPEGKELDLLKSIKTDQVAGEELNKIISDLFQEIESLEPWNNIPAQPDELLLSNWVVKSRLKQLKADTRQ
eukprot:TRINITY_DN22569_c0_g1_i1.p1 TRINITY_DN22569_c0_g1~~TRINITY_DN22569_c0_g1_i1.p1  ORF type:complete len:246 (+),score=56.79 TRINITY_DN22569_c0_g1_i1:62-799(+)